MQAYVLPTEHPQLDSFCIELTGIQQQQVDAAQQLEPVLARHHEWLQECGMFKEGVNATAVTWTSWDLAVSGTKG
jgi:inhibitor of KinA sporulation pathway (predicted exonuclease)